MKKLNTILLVGLVSTFVFASCNNNAKGGGWNAQDKNAWMRDCKNAMGNDESVSKLCNCMLSKMEKDYANYNDANTRGGEQLGASLRQQCDKELGNNNNNKGNNNRMDNNNDNDDQNGNNKNDNDDDDDDDDDNN